MKVRITGSPITMYGNFSSGQILESPRYPAHFLTHLVNDCKIATVIDYNDKMDHVFETKNDQVYDPVKKNQSSPLLEPDEALTNQTVKKPKKKHKL